MSHLTEEEQQLYKAYLTSKKMWFDHIKDIASTKYSKRLNTLGKKYGTTDHIFYYLNKGNQILTESDNKVSIS
jgi:hypothetical protein